MTRNNKLLATLIFSVIIVLVVLYGLYTTFYYSSVEVTIEGNHQATSAMLFVDETRIYPQGNEGRTYKAKVRPGSTTVRYIGPDIKESNESIDAKLFTTEKLTIESEPQTAEQTASLILPEGLRPVTSSVYIGPTSWLVVSTVDESDPTIGDAYIYKFTEDGWSPVIGSLDEKSLDGLPREASEQLFDYLDEGANLQ